MATQYFATLACRDVALTTSESTLYTVPTGGTFIAKKCGIYNTTAAPLTVDIYIDNASNGDYFCKSLSIPANSVILLDTFSGQVMVAGESIKAVASATGVYISRISGGLIQN